MFQKKKKSKTGESVIKGRTVQHTAETIRRSAGHMVVEWGSGGQGVRRRDLRGPGDNAERRVGVVHAREHGVRAADIPVVVVALDGHDGRVWKTTGGQSD